MGKRWPSGRGKLKMGCHAIKGIDFAYLICSKLHNALLLQVSETINQGSVWKNQIRWISLEGGLNTIWAAVKYFFENLQQNSE
jgi:hypothetical protein